MNKKKLKFQLFSVILTLLLIFITSQFIYNSIHIINGIWYHCMICFWKCVLENNFYYERNHLKTDIYRKKKNFLNIGNILKNIFKNNFVISNSIQPLKLIYVIFFFKIVCIILITYKLLLIKYIKVINIEKI